MSQYFNINMLYDYLVLGLKFKVYLNADSLFGLNESPRTNTPLETTPSVSDSKDMLLLCLKSARRSGYRL